MEHLRKNGLFVYPAIALIVLCALRIGFVTGMHAEPTLEGWYRGFDVFSTAVTRAALCGIVAALACWGLKRLGQFNSLYALLAVVLVAAAGVQSWHERLTKENNLVTPAQAQEAAESAP